MQKGITLVALVITVIVLIILAGVTLSTLVGDNGIITKAQEAKQNMANAAAEEDKLIQNLLNELKGIEAGGGEIEIPDPPIEPEEPTIEEVLKEGDYVWYEDAYGTQQKCIILYGPENENYSSYGIQMITESYVGTVALGVSDFDTNKDNYNNVITILNTRAEEYRKKDDGIAELARCVGSMPDNPSYDGAAMFVGTYSYLSSYNRTFKDKDNNYESDCNQINKLGITNYIGTSYWLASRNVESDSSNTFFYIRYIGSNGVLSNAIQCFIRSDRTELVAMELIMDFVL